MTRTLSARLRLALGLTAAASVVITAIVSVGLVRRYAADAARDDLVRIARAVAQADVTRDGGFPRGLRLAELQRLLRVNGDEFAIVGEGALSRANGSPAGVEVAAAVDLGRALAGGFDEGRVRVSTGEYVWVAVPAPRARGGAILIARPIGLTRDLWVPIIGRVLLAGLIATVAAVIVSGVLGGRLAKPLRALSEAARRVARGDLSHRVPVSGGEELAELAASFNHMSEELAESQRREREFLASVSHELRTPVTAIRGYVEALQDGAVDGEQGRAEALRIIGVESQRLQRLVSDVMELARIGGSGFGVQPVPTDLGATVGETVSAHASAASDAGISLTVDAPQEVRVGTDPDRIKQVVGNLLDNAVRVTGSGGRVAVSVRAAPDGGAVVDVADTGPGIAVEDLPNVFERGYLWKVSKGSQAVGTGLGLAIVRELVSALGGTIRVGSEIGRGTTFRITLPAEAPVRASPSP